MSTQKHKSVLKHADPMATTFEPSKNSSELLKSYAHSALLF